METTMNNDGGDIRIFQYNGSDITFNSGQSVMVNATQMAKPFGKRPAKWLELPSTKEFLSKLIAIRKSDTDMVVTESGGATGGKKGGGGTWMHEDVALEFARWLSPEFAIWCNDRIKELLRHGMTATQPTIDAIIADPAAGIRLLQALQQERGERQRLEQVNAEQAATLEQRRHTIALQTAQLQKSAPKVSYYEQTLLSASTITMTQVAKSLGLNVDELTSKLKSAGIIYRQSGQWLLKDPYCHWDLHKTRTAAYTRSDGQQGTNLYTVWTERGRRYITALHAADFDPRQAVRLLRETLDSPPELGGARGGLRSALPLATDEGRKNERTTPPQEQTPPTESPPADGS